MQTAPSAQEPAPDASSSSQEDAKRLAELERLWNEKFTEQPKLPTSALLSVAVSMALAFGGAVFALSASLRMWAMLWFGLSALIGLLARYFSRSWYRNEVVPWDRERRATAAEIAELRRRLKGQ